MGRSGVPGGGRWVPDLDWTEGCTVCTFVQVISLHAFCAACYVHDASKKLFLKISRQQLSQLGSLHPGFICSAALNRLHRSMTNGNWQCKATVSSAVGPDRPVSIPKRLTKNSSVSQLMPVSRSGVSQLFLQRAGSQVFLALWAACSQDSRLLLSGNVTQMEGCDPIKLYLQKRWGWTWPRAACSRGFPSVVPAAAAALPGNYQRCQLSGPTSGLRVRNSGRGTQKLVFQGL